MLLFFALLIGTAPWINSMQLPDLSSGGFETMQGRIVMYDWALHETTANDDFVFKVLGPHKDEMHYVRVIYGPLSGWGCA